LTTHSISCWRLLFWHSARGSICIKGTNTKLFVCFQGGA